MASIELPGEANPLNRQNLFNALVAAAGTTQQQVQTGGQQLQNWERQEGYYSLLQVGLTFPVQTVWKPTNGVRKGYLCRLFFTDRSSIPLHHPIEEWYR